MDAPLFSLPKRALNPVMRTYLAPYEYREVQALAARSDVQPLDPVQLRGCTASTRTARTVIPGQRSRYENQLSSRLEVAPSRRLGHMPPPRLERRLRPIMFPSR